MQGGLYDAAGNRILWLYTKRSDARDTCAVLAGKRSRPRGAPDLGQDLTACLYDEGTRPRAVFWNRDGTPEDICGNALRCLAHFASWCRGKHHLSIDVRTGSGTYRCGQTDGRGAFSLGLKTVSIIEQLPDGDGFVDVGTPHRLRCVADVNDPASVQDARRLSTGEAPVNFTLVRRAAAGHYLARCFERGVGETGSCATAAAAIALSQQFPSSAGRWRIEFASGHVLEVRQDGHGDKLEISGVVQLLQRSGRVLSPVAP